MRPLSLPRRSLAILVAATALLIGHPVLSQTMAPGVTGADVRDSAQPEVSSPDSFASMTHYVVRSGDTLSSIGAKFFTRPENWRQVQAINGIANPRRLQVGTVLRIPNRFFRSTAAEARIIGFRGAVTLTRSGTSVAPRLNQTLGEGDIIETGPNAFLRLALSDGGNISVPSNTRLRVERLRADIMTGALDQSFSVLQGRIESRVSSVRPGGGYTVRTPVSVSAVRGTVFRTTFAEDTGLATSGVIEGAVAVGAGETSDHADLERVSPGFGAVVSEAGVRVVRLPEPAYLVDPDRPQSEAIASFDIIPVPGASSYRAQLMFGGALTAPFAEAESPPGQARVSFTQMPDSLEDGHYLVSISALTAEGLEGPASVYDFLRVKNGLRDLAAERSSEGSYVFRWTSEGMAVPVYRFQLARRDQDGSDMTPFIDLAELKDNRVEIPDLGAGSYSWRVRVSRQVKGQVVFLWSEPQTLTVRR